MSNSLGSLVEAVVVSPPVKDTDMKEAYQYWIVELTPIDLTKLFPSSNHVGPQMIIEMELREDIPPSPCIIDYFVSSPDDIFEAVLGNLNHTLSDLLN